MFMANVSSSAYDQTIFIMHFLSTLNPDTSTSQGNQIRVTKFFTSSKSFQLYNYVQSNARLSLQKCAKSYIAQAHNNKQKEVEVTKGKFLH